MTDTPVISDRLLRLALRAGSAIMEVYTSPQTDWEVERKADNSPLTLADRRSHEVIAEGLSHTPWPVLSEEGEHLPYEARRGWERFWLVDPLDGTKEFLKRNGEFTVNIALIEGTRPVAGVIYVPARGLLYWGEEGRGAFVARVDAETLAVGTARALPLSELKEGRSFRVVASRSHLSADTEAVIARYRALHPDLETVSAGSSMKFCLVAEGRADVYPRLAPTMEWDTGAGHAICLAAGHSVVDAMALTPLVYNKPDLHNPFFLVE